MGIYLYSGELGEPANGRGEFGRWVYHKEQACRPIRAWRSFEQTLSMFPSLRFFSLVCYVRHFPNTNLCRQLEQGDGCFVVKSDGTMILSE